MEACCRFGRSGPNLFSCFFVIVAQAVFCYTNVFGRRMSCAHPVYGTRYLSLDKAGATWVLCFCFQYHPFWPMGPVGDERAMSRRVPTWRSLPLCLYLLRIVTPGRTLWRGIFVACRRQTEPSSHRYHPNAQTRIEQCRDSTHSSRVARRYPTHTEQGRIEPWTFPLRIFAQRYIHTTTTRLPDWSWSARVHQTNNWHY